MKYSITLLFLVGLLAFPTKGTSQEVVLANLSPGFGPVQLEHLTLVSLTNLADQPLSGFIRSYLLGPGQEQIVEIRSYNFQIAPGAAKNSITIPWNRQPLYGASPAARFLSRTGILNSGNYTLCVEFLDAGNNILGVHCDEKNISPNLSLSLIYPFDAAVISEPRPILNWENLDVFSTTATGVRYALQLTEVLPGQSAAAALEQNLPLLSKQGLRKTSLLYPVNAPKLEVGKRYAWSIRASVGGNEVATTQVWTFTLDQLSSTTTKPVEKASSFAMLDTKMNSKYYVFGESLNIGFDNNEGVSNLTYRIVDLQNPQREMGKLPAVTLDPGLNTITIPTEKMGLQPDQLYQIVVETPRGQAYFLRFRYQP